MRSLLLSMFLLACASPTGATCPDSNAPTYGSFGSDFFAKYCTDCHSAQSTDRHDAPGDQNFDTIDDIRKHADDIDEQAASGPNGTNTAMPELSAVVKTEPTMAERVLLGQFLACVKEGKN